MLNNLLGMGGGIDVFVTVSPSCGLEMIALDGHGNIASYAQAELEYNEAQREIANYDNFRAALQSLFEMRNINPTKARVHLSLPTVWFGTKEGLPLLLDDNAITNIVLGELEQTYIFKRKDPIPYWFDALASSNSDSRNIFYTAVQKDAIEQIRTIVESFGASLVSAECSLFAELKALFLTGIAAEQMQDGYSWNLMIVNNSGFQMIGMQGKRILEFYEEPLPLKSYEGEEIYSAISEAAQISLVSSPANALVIISETNLVSAEILAGKLDFAGSTIAVEDNEFKKEPLMELSLNILADDQLKVSLNAIGATAPAGCMPVNVNFITDATGGQNAAPAVIEIDLGGGKMYQLTPQKATAHALVLLALIFVPLGLTYYTFQNKAVEAQAKIGELDAQITQLDSELQAYQQAEGQTEFNSVAAIERTLRNNRIKIMSYAALGESIPPNLYLTYFITGDDGLINIKGCADSVEDVYIFFNNLKDSLIESNLRLSKLDLKSESLDNIVNSTVSTIDTAPYVFEITNMSADQLTAFMNKLMGKDEVKTDENKSAADKPKEAGE